MRITKLHRVISCMQSDWLKPYIVFNTEALQKVKPNQKTDIVKLMNHAVCGNYGKYKTNGITFSSRKWSHPGCQSLV